MANTCSNLHYHNRKFYIWKKLPESVDHVHANGSSTCR